MRKSKLAIILFLYSVMAPVMAATYTIKPGSDIVGYVQTTVVQPGDTVDDISQKFDVGVYELIEANPHMNPRRLSSGDTLIIPSQFILPPGPRKGIVINLAELRLYYYQKNGTQVTTHPISIGRPEWETPIASGKVVSKKKNPSWRPPDSIRAWYDENDMFLPEVVPPGPDNPLGNYAMRLSIPGYLIHGTNLQGNIGIRTSSGCIRMFPADIESLFYKVKVGDPVRIIHKPYKIGKHYNKIYAETHEPLSGSYYNRQSAWDEIKQTMEEGKAKGLKFDNELAKRALLRSQGYPTLIE